MGNFKRERLSLEDFWSKHQAEASTLLDAQSVQKVLQGSTSWASVGADLKVLTASSLLGRNMFEGAVRLLATEEFGVSLTAILSSLQNLAETVTLGRVEEMRSKLNTAAEEAARGSHLLGRREVEVDFMQLRLKVQVASTQEECHLRLAACIKEMAIAKTAGLPALSFEEALAAEAGSLQRPTFEEAVLTPFRAASTVATDLIMEVEAGSDASALLESKRAVYLALDSTFGVELAAAKAVSGEAGQALVEKLALSCMPSSAKVVTMVAATRELAALAAGNLYRMTSRSTQASVNTLREIVASFMSGVMPQWPQSESPFMEQAKKRSLWFAAWAPPDVDGVGPQDPVAGLRGPDAVKACYAFVQTSFAEGSDERLSLQDVELLFLHSWTLGVDERKALRGWTDKLVARVGGGTFGATAGSGAPPPKRARIGAKKVVASRSKDDAAADDARQTMDFFA